MKSASEIFKECAAAVNEEFQDASASGRLQAAIKLTELTMRWDNSNSSQYAREHLPQINPNQQVA